MSSILVVANRSDADRTLLEKALRLARSLGAQINLLSCDTALAKALQHSRDNENAEKAWNACVEHLAYLRDLRAMLARFGRPNQYRRSVSQPVV